MYKCPECDFENREGVFFCERCGFAIGTAPVLTTALPEDSRKPAYVPSKGSRLGPTGEVTLHCQENPTPLVLKIADEVTLGRAGNGTSRLRDFIDLDRYRASERGVSRRHAMIYRRGSELYIRDLNSTNHTFVNGMQVPDDRDFLLQDEDEIALGKLILRIRYA